MIQFEEEIWSTEESSWTGTESRTAVIECVSDGMVRGKASPGGDPPRNRADNVFFHFIFLLVDQ